MLDFGLAKALDRTNAGHFSGADRVAQSPTITSPAMTRVGMFLGTAAYMAPEQARGAVVDKRADIWAFGVVGAGHRFPYAVARDGKRFLMYISDVHAPPTIAVIVNWPALLNKQ